MSEPIYCTGGCDACRDYARELGVPLIAATPPASALTNPLEDVKHAAEDILASLDYIHDLMLGEPDEAATPPASAEREHVAEHEREVVDAAKEVARYWTPGIDAMAGIGGIHALDRLRDAVAALPRAAEARDE